MAWWLLSSLPALPKTAEEVTARQGALQIALAAGAGIGAAITVMLTFRRQRHQELNALITSQQADRVAELAERVAEHNKQDATERRVTELYTKAAEQLGHDKAAVRLAGLYALERLAQDNPNHRQTIVKVICAYLRMPAPPSSVDQPQARPETVCTARHFWSSLIRNPSPVLPVNAEQKPFMHDAEGEWQVRITAEHILTDHLRDERTPEQHEGGTTADSRFWEGMRIDLTGATLTDLDFRNCYLVDARFVGTTFTGNAQFDGATFTGDARFNEATFAKEAWFDRATFTGNAQTEAWTSPSSVET
ncbi:pentapeptide repeat-containing protein [Streptosporangium sp. NPDC000095]|uniref:pentapeptide repeat-containing protein n=1 Tax=Streptosporangium sp. NPDC000095 TaxID=3366184 RepID=UPI003693636B